MPEFDIVIAGAGIVGLAASIGLRNKGHNVLVVESFPALQVFGDHIAAAANTQRVLAGYGILDDFYSVGKGRYGALKFRRYSSDEIISVRDMRDQEKVYGYPSWHISRPDFQKLLYDAAEKRGVRVQFDSRVSTVEDNEVRPALILENGSRIDADLIIGADGVKSAVRNFMYPGLEPISEGHCFRALIPSTKLAAHPEFAPYFTGLDFWMGPERLFMIGSESITVFYPNGSGIAGNWKKPGDVLEMREKVKDFSPLIRKLLDLVDECTEWKVVEIPPLPSWVSRGGKVAIIGDAAHGMSPYQGQGAAMGLEDGAALGECLERAKSIEDIPRLLHAFESIRKPRAELLSKVSANTSHLWQLPDGEAQQKRDKYMKSTPMWKESDAWDGTHIDDIPESATDPTYQEWVMAHNVISFTNRQLDKILS